MEHDEQSRSEFREALGPELEYLAESLEPALTKFVETVAATTIAPIVKPLEDEHQAAQQKRAAAATATVMKEFGDRHSDWQEHEDAMFALSEKLQPAAGMTQGEYLDSLYTIVTASKSQEAITTAIADGLAEKERARHARPAGNPTIREAFEAAKAGIRFEPEADDAAGDADEDADRGTPTGGRTLRDAFEAAKQGIRWE